MKIDEKFNCCVGIIQSSISKLAQNSNIFFFEKLICQIPCLGAKLNPKSPHPASRAEWEKRKRKPPHAVCPCLPSPAVPPHALLRSFASTARAPPSERAHTSPARPTPPLNLLRRATPPRAACLGGQRPLRPSLSDSPATGGVSPTPRNPKLRRRGHKWRYSPPGGGASVPTPAPNRWRPLATTLTQAAARASPRRG